MERFWDARAREDAWFFVDTGAAGPDAFWARGEEALGRLLGAVDVAVDPAATVVDIGCGLGRLTRPLAARARHVVAIDVSSEMLERARRLNAGLGNVDWLHGDGVSLRPIRDGSADLCVSHVVFRHIPDPLVTLGYVQEIGRVLRPGGLAAIEFSNDPAVHADAGEAAEWRGAAVDLDDLHTSAEAAGLEVERVAGAGTEYCVVRLRRLEDAPEASFYDRYWAAPRTPRYEPEPELRSLLLTHAAGADVLDVGCGAGNGYAPEVAERARSYTGVDVSAHAVGLARERGLEAVVVEDASRLPFEDASFDVALCVEVLEHLLRPDEAVVEARRVLRPGGRLVVSAPNVAYWRLRLDLATGLWNPAGDALSIEQPWRDPHVRFFTTATLERMLRAAGFHDVVLGAHGGRLLDHLTRRPTAFGRSRLYGIAERRVPSLLGATLHAVAER
jgi:methionine biosynthesis protein MetW